MSRLPLFALALAVAACAPAETDVMTEPDAGAMPADTAPMPADPAGAVTAEGTLDAAQSAGGLTNLAPATAVSNIDGWIARLDGVPSAAPIVANLQTLRSQLQDPVLDGLAIGQTLSTLGEQTSAAADGDVSLEQLGQALSQAGTMLMGM
ncbi:hypothetical protein RQM47_02990 [Rubrivirga sp. S365]|uniref:Lipoprotein n=1 Tax=Rubrivirga litoralis TaxID=3075598 RepID=A0ABU3BQV4_9BACT|nr:MULTISPECIES: hypothetical protein [unclassified Rubrivirga]MDT0631660.1 hypothetical protein [Rubrivirga sp. F394]MDT7855597.1 hypothetical protein [Rubrivirga sp. S365]